MMVLDYKKIAYDDQAMHTTPIEVKGMEDEKLIEEIMRHLDKEVSTGSMRMSVEVDENQEEHAKVSHKCCKVYGKDSTRIVGELDMYSDLYLNDMKQRGEL